MILYISFLITYLGVQGKPEDVAAAKQDEAGGEAGSVVEKAPDRLSLGRETICSPVSRVDRVAATIEIEFYKG